jgi:hypothetical protein
VGSIGKGTIRAMTSRMLDRSLDMGPGAWDHPGAPDNHHR